MKRYRLHKMKISEVSLVDNPASPGANVLFFKRGEDDVTLQEQFDKAQKDLTAAEAARVELQKNLDTALAAKTEADKAKDAAVVELNKANETIVDLKAKVPGDPEDPYKGLPADIAKRLKDSDVEKTEMAKRLKVLEDGNIEKAFVDVASTLKSLTVEPAKFGPVLKRIASGEAKKDDVDEVMRVLKAADAAVEKGGIAKEVGDGGYEMTGAEAQMDLKTKEIQKANPGMTEAVAFSKAIGDNPGLYSQYLKEQRQATH